MYTVLTVMVCDLNRIRSGVPRFMGRKHREVRKAIKARLKLRGWRENEFGELVKKGSKAEARRVLLQRQLLREHIENEIIELAVKRAREDICAIEDVLVFAQINEVTQMESAHAP